MTLLSCAGTATCAELCASAPAATRGWLLIEHAGPWPAFGYPGDLPTGLTRTAEHLLHEGVRPQLIRRTDRVGRRGDGVRAVFLAGGDTQGGWIERVDPGLLSGRRRPRRLNAATFRSGRPPGLGGATGPMLLVCTHGRREVCCARFGRPVAVALAARFGPLVWETTHVGGDEFAANLVVLPQGAYFGRLDPRQAVVVAEHALAGRLELSAYRGTAGRSAQAQRAEWLLRRRLGEPGFAAVVPLACCSPEAHCFAHVRPDGSRTHYEVRFEPAADGRRRASITVA